MEAKNSFVFVVCGAKEHIDTLNFSLRALRSHTDLPILVVTDLFRNEYDIEHDKEGILDIRTPEEYDHHQASIYLKTGLQKFLPLEKNVYCYLDSDVVALNKEINRVFDYYIAPITFCSDHCRMDEFSSSAVNCGCDEKPDSLQKALDKYEHLYKKNEDTIARLLREWRKSKVAIELDAALSDWYNAGLNANHLERRARLIELTKPGTPVSRLLRNYLFKVLPNYRRSLFEKVWKDRDGTVLIDEGRKFDAYMKKRGFIRNKKANVWQTTEGKRIERPFESFKDFFERQGYYYEHKTDRWYTMDNELFAVNRTLEIEKETGYRYIHKHQYWVDNEGNTVFNNRCDHLKEAISNRFGINVQNRDWQHWNGGVFLFSESSVGFMDTWHELTLEAFSIPYWKTRDQGTLISTVWKLGLQNQHLLPKKFNFIADYNHPTMLYEGNLKFRLRPDGELINPYFVHIYHHWGDTEWSVWNDVATQLK